MHSSGFIRIENTIVAPASQQGCLTVLGRRVAIRRKPGTLSKMPIGVRAAKRGLPPIPAFGIGWLYPVCPHPQGLPYGKRFAWPCPPKTVKHPRSRATACGSTITPEGPYPVHCSSQGSFHAGVRILSSPGWQDLNCAELVAQPRVLSLDCPPDRRLSRGVHHGNAHIVDLGRKLGRRRHQRIHVVPLALNPTGLSERRVVCAPLLHAVGIGEVDPKRVSLLEPACVAIHPRRMEHQRIETTPVEAGGRACEQESKRLQWSATRFHRCRNNPGEAK